MLRSSYYYKNRFCEVCGSRIKFDLKLSKGLKEQIFINGFEYMCPSCIMRRLEEIKKDYKYELIEVWRPDLKWSPEDSQGENALRKCSLNHDKVYHYGIKCPVCKMLEGFNELRDMYFEEYQKNERKRK